jgi:hypothetical protein
MPDHYQTLGLPSNASIIQVSSAYKKLAKIHHPDRGGDEEAFKTILHAYESIKNPQQFPTTFDDLVRDWMINNLTINMRSTNLFYITGKPIIIKQARIGNQNVKRDHTYEYRHQISEFELRQAYPVAGEVRLFKERLFVESYVLSQFEEPHSELPTYLLPIFQVTFCGNKLSLRADMETITYSNKGNENVITLYFCNSDIELLKPIEGSLEIKYPLEEPAHIYCNMKYEDLHSYQFFSTKNAIQGIFRQIKQSMPEIVAARL